MSTDPDGVSTPTPGESENAEDNNHRASRLEAFLWFAVPVAIVVALALMYLR